MANRSDVPFSVTAFKAPARYLTERFTRSRDDVALIDIEDGTFSYGVLYANAAAIADAWRAQGAVQGDRISFILPNGAGYVAAYLACAVGGFCACPIVPDLADTSIDYILDLARPRLVVRDMPALAPNLPAPDAFPIAAGDTDPFVIIFSSGTTGNPKGICHSLAAVVGNATAFAAMSAMTPATRLYHVLPMAYMAGFQNTILCPLLAGGAIILGPAFSPANALTFWQRPVARHANFLTLTPAIAAALARLGARDPDKAKANAANLVSVQCTAGQLTRGTRTQFLEVFGKPLQDCYGVTELGGPFTLQSPEEALTEETVGHPLPGLEISVLGHSASEGDLWIKTPAVMLGYLGHDGLDPPVLSDGFMATGDIAAFEDDKLTITGRVKDMIIKGGVNVAPIAVENVISELDEVEDVAVIGVNHDFWGEIIVACVQAKAPEAKNRLKLAVQNHCARRLPSIHRPDQTIIVDGFPRAMNGKIQKHVLRDDIAKALAG